MCTTAVVVASLHAQLTHLLPSPPPPSFMLMAMGFAGLGTVIRYIPRPVVSGFTAG